MKNKNPLSQTATDLAQQQLQALRSSTTGITSAKHCCAALSQELKEVS